MSKRSGLMTKALFFVVLFGGICWTEAGDAFEPWDGKAMTGLNVRKNPGVRGQIIDWLKGDQRVTINDENGKWYKIIFEIEGERYREGWVHGKYIQKVFPQEEDISSALAKVREGIALENLPEKELSGVSAGEEHQPKEIEKKLNKVYTPAATNMVEEQPRVVSQAKSPVLKTEVNTNPPPAITSVAGDRVDIPARTIIPVVKTTSEQELLSSQDRKEPIDTLEIKELTKLAFRLLSVVFSCFAILFSYKALKLANISYNTSKQFERNLQSWQRREDGKRGQSEHRVVDRNDQS